MIPSHRFDKRISKPLNEFCYSLKFRDRHLQKSQKKSAGDLWALGASDSWFFRKLKNLEFLQIPMFIAKMELVQMVNGKEIPLTLFSSLKKLHLGGMASRESNNLSTKQVIWILIFAPQLKSAIFGCTMSPSDFDYLSELNQIYNALSGIEHLALFLTFISKAPNSTSRWNRRSESAVEWIGGSKRSAAIYYLTLVTKGLKSFELWLRDRGGTETLEPVFHEGLMGLKQSFETLEKFRLFNIGYKNQGSFDYSSFKNLKFISLLSSSLAPFTYWHDFNLPQSLECIELPSYVFEEDDIDKYTALEEDTIQDIVKFKNLINLREIIVPSRPINGEGNEPKSPTIMKLWNERRAAWGNLEQIKSGALNLRLFERRENRELKVEVI